MSNNLSVRCNGDARVYLQGYPTSKTIAKAKKKRNLLPWAVLRKLACVFIASRSSDTRIAVVVKIHSTAGNTLHALLRSIENEKTSGYFLIEMFTV